jgi:uncharacterized protein
VIERRFDWLATLSGVGLVWAVASSSIQSGCSSEAPLGGDDTLPGEGVELPSGEVFTRRALLDSAASCIESKLGELAQRSAAFELVTADAFDDPSARDASQRAWRELMEVTQQLEVMQIGPAASPTDPGGLGLRDAIYAWPLLSTCTIDEHLVAETYAAANPDEILVNARGLGAAEYLLFHEGDEHGCGVGHELDATGAWSELGTDELARRRAVYAAFVAREVAVTARDLQQRWSAGFGSELRDAGRGSRTYTRERNALNALSDALFYVEWASKDLKLAGPTGLVGCDSATCPELVESRYAGASKQHLRNNLLGFRQRFTGCSVGDQADDRAQSGLGFDDFLHAVGEPDLGLRIDEAVLEALAALDAIEEDDLAEALTRDLPSVVAAHAAHKRITDMLRTDFVAILEVELPKRVEGDND